MIISRDSFKRFLKNLGIERDLIETDYIKSQNPRIVSRNISSELNHHLYIIIYCKNLYPLCIKNQTLYRSRNPNGPTEYLEDINSLSLMAIYKEAKCDKDLIPKYYEEFILENL